MLVLGQLDIYILEEVCCLKLLDCVLLTAAPDEVFIRLRVFTWGDITWLERALIV